MIKARAQSDKETMSSGKLPFLTVDYIQLACLGGHSVRIEIQDGGILFGNVVIWEGEIWSAEQGHLKGRAALQTLIFAIAAQVHNLRREEHRGPRNIPQNHWQKILLEASLCLDDGTRQDLEQTATTRPESNLKGMDFPELENLALDAMLDKRYDEAWPALVHAHNLDPQNRRVEANLERLRSLGYGGDE